MTDNVPKFSRYMLFSRFSACPRYRYRYGYRYGYRYRYRYRY